MNIQIRGIGIPPTAALAAHIERRLAFSLSRFSAQIERVVVRFSDMNGPRGGSDKVCRVGFTPNPWRLGMRISTSRWTRRR